MNKVKEAEEYAYKQIMKKHYCRWVDDINAIADKEALELLGLGWYEYKWLVIAVDIDTPSEPLSIHDTEEDATKQLEFYKKVGYYSRWYLEVKKVAYFKTGGNEQIVE